MASFDIPEKKYPGKLTASILNSIFEKMIAGKSVSAICKEKIYPKGTYRNLQKVICSDPDIIPLYKMARELQFTRFFEEIIEIVDEPYDPNGDFAPGDQVKMRKLRYEARQWTVSRMAGCTGFRRPTTGNPKTDAGSIRKAMWDGELDMDSAKKLMDIVEQEARICKDLELEEKIDQIRAALGLEK